MNTELLTSRIARNTWIGELLKCRCRHGIGVHGPDGCEGDMFGSCTCRHDQDDVLTTAIAAETRLAPGY